MVSHPWPERNAGGITVVSGGRCSTGFATLVDQSCTENRSSVTPGGSASDTSAARGRYCPVPNTCGASAVTSLAHCPQDDPLRRHARPPRRRTTANRLLRNHLRRLRTDGRTGTAELLDLYISDERVDRLLRSEPSRDEKASGPLQKRLEEVSPEVQGRKGRSVEKRIDLRLVTLTY